MFQIITNFFFSFRLKKPIKKNHKLRRMKNNLKRIILLGNKRTINLPTVLIKKKKKKFPTNKIFFFFSLSGSALPEGAAGQCRALYDYSGENEGDLSFKEGDVIVVWDRSDPSGWWDGEVNGVRGFFPSNFVEEIA